MQLPLKEEFNFKDCLIAGDECWLITPKDMSVKWFDDNARFRSCIVRKSDHHVVSQGFLKFTNFHERPEFQPWDNSWEFEAIHKLDGSLLIISKYKGELIVRTRGTVDARSMPNGHEIDELITKYPKVFDNEVLNDGHSILVEWTTPSNVIVLREHNTPTLTLVGIISNRDAVYCEQVILDGIAEEWNINRPQRYHYNTIEECILDVDAWRGKEGVVLYSPDGQTLKKIKASEYCELHKICTGIKNVKQVMDLFLASPKFTTSEAFYKYVETTLDYEIAEKIKDDIENVVHAYNIFVDKFNRLTDVVNDLTYCDSRKEQAMVITSRYQDWRKSFAFNILDNYEIHDTVLGKAIHYELDKLLNK
jgi:hypothetical protein